MADDSGALGGCVLLASGPVQGKTRLVFENNFDTCAGDHRLSVPPVSNTLAYQEAG